MISTSRELKRRARATLEGKYFFATSLAALLSLFSSLMIYLLSGFLTSSEGTLPQAPFWILWVIMMLLNSLFEVGFIKFLYTLSSPGGTQIPGTLIYGFKNQPDTFILTAAFRYLITLIWFVPATFRYLQIPYNLELTALPGAVFPVLLLFLAGAVPAVFLALPYCLATYILLDDPYCSARDALRHSRMLMQGQKKRLFLLWLGFLPLCLVGIGSYGIGFLWIRPYYHTTMSQFYLDLKQSQRKEEDAAE